MNPENNRLVEFMGEGALRIRLPGNVDPRAVLEVFRALPGVFDVVVTEQHVALYFAPDAPPKEPASVLESLAHSAPTAAARRPIVIRARYDGTDLPRVAEFSGLTPDAVIELHAARDYCVRMIGFMPGFAYLAEVDARIAAPRLATPRPRVPVNAIGIAGRRTGIYPLAAPGGWNLIASALDFTAFDPARGAALQLGDRVRFEPI